MGSASKPLAWAIFLLPLTLCAGNAVQALGFYLCAIIIPFVILKRGRDLPKMRQLSLMFLLMWGMFPLGSLINATLSPEGFAGLSKVWRSHLSSALGVSGLVLLLLHWWLPRRSATTEPQLQNQPAPNQVYETFVQGMRVGMIILACLGAVQFLTGFDYLTGQILPANRQMASGHYRISLFAPHPLSLASIALANLAFFLVRLKPITRATWRQTPTAWWDSAAALACFALIVWGGARAVLCLAALFLVVFAWQKIPQLTYRLAGIAVGLAAATLLVLSHEGLADRFAELYNQLRHDNSQVPRLVFWQIHLGLFLDQPLLGQGFAQLESYRLQQAYAEAGLGTYFRKYNAHNIYLQFLADVGLVGSVAAIWAISRINRIIKGMLQQAASRTFFAATQAAFLANLAHGLTQNTLFDSHVTMWLLSFIWIILLSESDNQPVAAQLNKVEHGSFSFRAG